MGRWITIGLVIIAVIVIGFIAAAAYFPVFREVSRDIAIIILAVFQMITAILLIALLVGMLYAVQYIRTLSRTTIVPKIDLLTAKLDQVIDNTSSITGSAKNTVTTVSNTTSYVAEQVVAPVIRLSGLFAGVRAAAAFLARRNEPPGTPPV